MYSVDCEQSLSFPSIFLTFLRASVELWSSEILMSSARGGFQEQKPTIRSLCILFSYDLTFFSGQNEKIIGLTRDSRFNLARVALQLIIARTHHLRYKNCEQIHLLDHRLKHKLQNVPRPTLRYC